MSTASPQPPEYLPVLKIRVTTTPDDVELNEKEEAAKLRLTHDIERFRELRRVGFSEGPK